MDGKTISFFTELFNSSFCWVWEGGLYNEQRKTRVLIGQEEFVIGV